MNHVEIKVSAKCFEQRGELIDHYSNLEDVDSVHAEAIPEEARQLNPTTVQTKPFVKELEWCARFIERKTTIPILSNVMLRQADGLLHLTATDLELGATTSLEADGPDFELTVPVHNLLKYLKKVDEPAISLEASFTYGEPPNPVEGPHVSGCDGTGTSGCCDPPESAPIRTAKLTVRHGEDRMSVEGMSADSFPCLPSRPLQCFEIYGLETAIPRAAMAISSEESRFTLNGALLLVEKHTVKLIATDGHRLSVADAKLQDDPGPFKALIPRRALTEVARLGDSSYVCADENHAFFTTGHRGIVARKLTGNFPDWERVMPEKFKHSIQVNPAATRKTLERVALCADERSQFVRFSVNGALELFASRACDIEGTGRVPILNGPKFAYPFVSSYNANYVGEFLKACDGEVSFCFNKASEAAQWTAPGWRYVVMPARDVNEDGCLEGEFEPVPDVIAALDAAAATDITATPEPSPPPDVVDAQPVNADGKVDAGATALILKINHATVYNWLKRGKLPQPERIGRTWMWDRREIEALAG